MNVSNIVITDLSPTAAPTSAPDTKASKEKNKFVMLLCEMHQQFVELPRRTIILLSITT